MNNDLQVFNYNNSEVRTVLQNGDPWFVLKDVCKVFGEKNHKRVSARLDPDEKGVSQIATPGGKQRVTVISESGMYSVLFAMQPEKARGVSDEHIEQRQKQLHAFKRWVTHEVLPSIRKHGAYLSADALEAAATDPNYLPQLVETLRSENAALQSRIAADAAKVLLVESACREPVSVGKFADFIRQNTTIKATEENLFKYFRKNGYLSAPYDFPAEDSPYFEVSESVTSFSSGYVYIHKSLKITTEGQLFFLDKLINR